MLFQTMHMCGTNIPSTKQHNTSYKQRNTSYIHEHDHSPLITTIFCCYLHSHVLKLHVLNIFIFVESAIKLLTTPFIHLHMSHSEQPAICEVIKGFRLLVQFFHSDFACLSSYLCFFFPSCAPTWDIFNVFT